jgi:hypothetical protein
MNAKEIFDAHSPFGETIFLEIDDDFEALFTLRCMKMITDAMQQSRDDAAALVEQWPGKILARAELARRIRER